ncbi:MAG TPA: cell division protein FtsZ [Candidatus Paceibacterota bacterium]|nr:cell division protein FtsZ [Candidatus Paceibacterota bacterium]
MKKKIKQERFQPLSANVKVVGIGGGGGNAVSRMARDFYRGVDFIAINTDHQDLDQCGVRHKLYIGKNLTKGLGTGMNPDLGRQAAEENRSEIIEAVQGADLVFLSAGLGGGTGTGATPVVAEAAKQAGALTIAVVTKPFSFEGSQRERIAAEGLMKLRDKVDAIIVVPNDRIFTVISKDTPIMKAFESIDDVLRRALKGLVEIIAMPGIINVDFADVKNIMQDAGVAIVGVGVASGQDRAVNAVNLALHSPLLETSPEGAKAVLLGISGSRDLKMTEINEAAKVVAQTADPGARIIFGAYYDRNVKPGQIKVTIVAAGFNGSQPNSLFGGHFAGREQMFASRGTPAAEPMFSPKAGPVRGLKEPAASDAREPEIASAPAPRFASYQKKENGANGSGKDRDKDKEAPRDKNSKESDPWDIPAFLRRRKK